MNPQFSRAHGGKRPDLDNIYFRSSHEANYARYLNFLIAKERPQRVEKWAFEQETFEFSKIKRGGRLYTPDFKVWFCDGHIEYHEVKGWDYPKGKTQRKRMAKYYPNVTLVLVDQDFFKTLRQQHMDKLLGWE